MEQSRWKVDAESVLISFCEKEQIYICDARVLNGHEASTFRIRCSECLKMQRVNVNCYAAGAANIILILNELLSIFIPRHTFFPRCFGCISIVPECWMLRLSVGVRMNFLSQRLGSWFGW